MNSKIALGIILTFSVSFQDCNFTLFPSPPSLAPETSGIELVTGVDANTDLSISPNGKQIVFMKNEAIWICDTSGKNVSQLSPTNIELYNAKWSPDGKQLGAIQSNPKNAFVTLDLNSKTLSNKNINSIFVSTLNDGLRFYWDWSPNNELVAILCSNQDGGETLNVYATDGGGALAASYPVIASIYPSQVFQWSPDGSRIVLVSDLNGQKGIYIATVVHATADLIVPDSTASFVSWFPNGASISYMKSYNLHLFNLASKQDSVIASYIGSPYQVSPNGRYISYVFTAGISNPDDGYDYTAIQGYNLQSGEFGTIASSDFAGIAFSWAPSSNEVFYLFSGNLYKAIVSL